MAQQATDFWVEQWRLRGVEILSAELETKFDPEDDLWYFVIQLTCDTDLSIVEFVDKECEIIDILVRDESTSVWSLDYTVLTRSD